MAKKSVKELEKIATALYVKKEKGWSIEEDIVEQVVQLKPHIVKREAEEALDYLQTIEEKVALFLKNKDLAEV